MLRYTVDSTYGAQLPLPGLCVTDRPTPLLLQEKGLGEEVHATE
jgi:hypothetical protein